MTDTSPSEHPDCPFCDASRIASDVQHVRSHTLGVLCYVFEPLNPVTEGHVLVAPCRHTEHAAGAPMLAAGAMEVAAQIAAQHEAANIITSIGAAATQTIKHLHLHVVPRTAGDGLKLPWTPKSKAMHGPIVGHLMIHPGPSIGDGPGLPPAVAHAMYAERSRVARARA